MQELWLQELEPLEEISQAADTRQTFLRMAEPQREGRIASFLTELARDPGLDDGTKGTLVELAWDGDFLLAVDAYVRRSERCH